MPIYAILPPDLQSHARRFPLKLLARVEIFLPDRYLLGPQDIYDEKLRSLREIGEIITIIIGSRREELKPISNYTDLESGQLG